MVGPCIGAQPVRGVRKCTTRRNATVREVPCDDGEAAQGARSMAPATHRGGGGRPRARVRVPLRRAASGDLRVERHARVPRIAIGPRGPERAWRPRRCRLQSPYGRDDPTVTGDVFVRIYEGSAKQRELAAMGLVGTLDVTTVRGMSGFVPVHGPVLSVALRAPSPELARRGVELVVSDLQAELRDRAGGFRSPAVGRCRGGVAPVGGSRVLGQPSSAPPLASRASPCWPAW